MPKLVAFAVLLLGLSAAVCGKDNGSIPKMNVLMIAVDDLRPLFGASYATEEVLTPAIDAFFLEGGGTVLQRSYVQIAICGLVIQMQQCHHIPSH